MHHTTSVGIAASLPEQNTATLASGGPVHLRGDLVLIRQAFTVTHEAQLTLCRCGGSANKPFCDGSHETARFADDGMLRAPEKRAPPGCCGPVEIRVQSNGPLVLTGPLTLVGTNGRATFNETTFLCRCGGSRNKPYCDGTHVKMGFAG